MLCLCQTFVEAVIKYTVFLYSYTENRSNDTKTMKIRSASAEIWAFASLRREAE